jgi:hypothetical protein
VSLSIINTLVVTEELVVLPEVIEPLMVKNSEGSIVESFVVGIESDVPEDSCPAGIVTVVVIGVKSDVFAVPSTVVISTTMGVELTLYKLTLNE